MGQLLQAGKRREDLQQGGPPELPEAQEVGQTPSHPHKPWRWVIRKYWSIRKGKGWTFKSPNREGVWLQKHADVDVRRHIKVQGRRSPYDGDWIYWGTRMGDHPELPKRVAKLLRRQKGKCPWCGLHFADGDLLELDHKVPTAKGGKDLPSNWQMLHGHCHDQKTALDVSGDVGGIHDKDRAVEEPDDGKLSRPVLKTSHRGRPDG
jgi:RNA-directed DNA polymerase